MKKTLDKEVKTIDHRKYFLIGADTHGDKYYVALPYHDFSDGIIRIEKSPSFESSYSLTLTTRLVDEMIVGKGIVYSPLTSQEIRFLYNLLDHLNKSTSSYRHYRDVEIDYILSEKPPEGDEIGESLRDRAKRLSDDIFYGDILRMHEEIVKLLMP